MQQFIVPQFIDVEDKVLGPITVRQFFILLGVGIILFLAFRFGDFTLFVILTVFLGGGGLVTAFVKINGQAFHYFALNIIQTKFRRAKRRVWHKALSNKELQILRKQEPAVIPEAVAKQPVKRQRIQDLALLVNTGGFYHPEDDQF